VGAASYRLYNCRRCGLQVPICRACDHGNQYCDLGCADEARAETLRRAGRRYQRTPAGARRHAARQRSWRARRKQEVTHHGWPEGVPVRSATLLVVLVLSARQAADVATVTPTVTLPLCCHFCGRRLPPFARLGPLRG
jgi:hypothetical protein